MRLVMLLQAQSLYTPLYSLAQSRLIPICIQKRDSVGTALRLSVRAT